MSSILLTLCVPAFNCAKYLPIILNSLSSAKNINKIEILVVNDGSTDNTISVLNKYIDYSQKNYMENLKVINKPNGGHGSTINTAIKIAKGKYFKVLDGDDLLNIENFDKLIDTLSNNDSDLILNDLEIHNLKTNENKIFKIFNLKENTQYYLDECFEIGAFKKSPVSIYGPAIHTSTYKTSILRNNNIHLREKCFYDDEDYNVFGVIYSKTLTYYGYPVYIYNVGNPNQSTSPESYKKNVLMVEQLILFLINTYDNYQMSTQKKLYLFKTIIKYIGYHYRSCINNFNSSKYFKSFDTKLKKFREFYNFKFKFPSSRKIKFYRLFPFLIKYNKFITKIIHILNI